MINCGSCHTCLPQVHSATPENVNLVDFLIKQNAPFDDVELLKKFIHKSFEEGKSNYLLQILDNNVAAQEENKSHTSMRI